MPVCFYDLNSLQWLGHYFSRVCVSTLPLINIHLRSTCPNVLCHLQSYDSGFGQGSGRESHGEFSLCLC